VFPILLSALPSRPPSGQQIHRPVVALLGRAILLDKVVGDNAVKVPIGDRLPKTHISFDLGKWRASTGSASR
jgi:hypothetical protein